MFNHIKLKNCFSKYILHSDWQCMKVPVASHPRQSLILVFLTLVIPVGVMWFPFVVLIYISLMSNDAECLLCDYWLFLHILFYVRNF